MLLVTGGLDSSNEFLASTEVYRPSAEEWREVPGGALPRPMKRVSVVTLNNRVLLFGEKIIYLLLINCSYTYVGGADKYVNDYADILEYSDSKGKEKWTQIGKMSKILSFHSVSIIDFYKFKDYCQ